MLNYVMRWPSSWTSIRNKNFKRERGPSNDPFTNSFSLIISGVSVKIFDCFSYVKYVPRWWPSWISDRHENYKLAKDTQGTFI